MKASEIRRILATSTVSKASALLKRLKSEGKVIVRIDIDIPDPDNLMMALIACVHAMGQGDKKVAIFVTGRPVSPLMNAKKIQSESDPKPQFEIEYIAGDKIEKKIVPLATFLADYLVQSPNEYFDEELSILAHQYSVARVRAFLNRCGILPNVYQIFDGGIAKYACLHPAAHSPDFLFKSLLPGAAGADDSYIVATPEEIETQSAKIRDITSLDERKAYLKQLLTQPSERMRKMSTQEDYWKLLTQEFPDAVVSCLVGGPLTGLLETHRLYPELTERICWIQLMSMALTGEKNLFGNNFNIMVDPEATKQMLPVFESLGLQIVCISSETCKTPTYTVSGEDIRNLYLLDVPVGQALQLPVAIEYMAAIIKQWTDIKNGVVQPAYDVVTLLRIDQLVESVDVVPIQPQWTQNPKSQMTKIPGLENTGLIITPIGPALTPDSIYAPGVYITGTTITDQARELFLGLFK